MATVTASITKNSLSFSGGVTGVTGVGKQTVIEVSGTPETGDKFNIRLGDRNFGFVNKPTGRVVALATLKNKVHALSGTLWYFSGISTPAGWEFYIDDRGDIGAGFINLASEFEGAEPLTGLGVYQNNMALFSRWSTQIWYVDQDPVGNRQLQVLDNIGCLAPATVVSVGDVDLFFLSDTGLRSLRARDSSNAAFVSDIGTPIDPLVIAKLRTLTEDEKHAAVAVIEPEDGRYLLQLGDEIFTFSFFSGAKISAWSNYETADPFTRMAVLAGRVYARTEGNRFIKLGGASNDTYDDTVVTVETPFMDARAPATWKGFQGIDIGIEGTWTIKICTDTTQPNVWETVGTLENNSFSMQRIPVTANTSHFKLQLTSSGTGYARLSNVMAHYESNEAA